MNLNVPLKCSQRVKLQTRRETPPLCWLSQLRNVLEVFALLEKLTMVPHPCLVLYNPQPSNITQGRKLAFN